MNHIQSATRFTLSLNKPRFDPLTLRFMTYPETTIPSKLCFNSVEPY